MSEFTKSLSSREKLLLCQYTNEHNFNWNLIARSLTSHPLLVSRSPGFFTSQNCKGAYNDLLSELDNEQDNPRYTRDLSSRPQLRLAKKYFKIHVDEIKESIWQHERNFRSIVQDINSSRNNQHDKQPPTKGSSIAEPETHKEPVEQPPVAQEESRQEHAVAQNIPTIQLPEPEEAAPKDADQMDITSEEPKQEESNNDTGKEDPPKEESPKEEHTQDNSAPSNTQTEETTEAAPQKPVSPTNGEPEDVPQDSEEMQVDTKPEEPKETRRTSKRKSITAETADKQLSSVSDETPEDSSSTSTTTKRRKSTLDESQKKTQKVLLLCLEDITTHKAGPIFTQPIRKSEAPAYHDLIYSPIDLSAIKRKIRDGQITTAQQFTADILLMFANSIMYNPQSSDVHEMAQDMMKYSEKQIAKFFASYD